MQARHFLSAAVVLAIALCSSSPAAPPGTRSINGHGIWAQDTGDVYENHQPYLESTMINAWVDECGQPRGTIVWMDVYNGLFGAQGDEHGQGVSGYTWQVEVDTYIMFADNEVYVEGEIVHSNVPSDIGGRNGFFVRDNGDTPNDPPDEIGGTPLIRGNFRIR